MEDIVNDLANNLWRAHTIKKKGAHTKKRAHTQKKGRTHEKKGAHPKKRGVHPKKRKTRFNSANDNTHKYY